MSLPDREELMGKLLSQRQEQNILLEQVRLLRTTVVKQKKTIQELERGDRTPLVDQKPDWMTHKDPN
jgi:hypothetical protein